MHGTIDAERKRSSSLFEENQRLQKELDQVKLELKLERQTRFATNQQKAGDQPAASKPASDVSPPKKKRGAPDGHPGWYRKTPTEYDWAVDVLAPSCCPHCRGDVTLDEAFPPSEHLQEDVVDNQYRVVLYRHPAARCNECGDWLQQPGEGELLGSRIGIKTTSIPFEIRVTRRRRLRDGSSLRRVKTIESVQLDDLRC